MLYPANSVIRLEFSVGILYSRKQHKQLIYKYLGALFYNKDYSLKQLSLHQLAEHTEHTDWSNCVLRTEILLPGSSSTLAPSEPD